MTNAAGRRPGRRWVVALRVVLASAVLWSSSGLSTVSDASGVGQDDADSQGTAARSGQVDIVETVGCVEQRGGPEGAWWLTRSPEPVVSEAGVFNRDQVDEARATALGVKAFELVGIAEFLDSDGLLRSGTRAAFTTPDQVNATGDLRPGHKVLVKGLLIETDETARINLLAVVGLRDDCEAAQ